MESVEEVKKKSKRKRIALVKRYGFGIQLVLVKSRLGEEKDLAYL